LGEGEEDGEKRGEMAQTMYTHMNKCINDWKKKKEINNKRQDYKIGTVYKGTHGRKENEWRLRWGNMVNGL
jgi:predicted secreted protein